MSAPRPVPPLYLPTLAFVLEYAQDYHLPKSVGGWVDVGLIAARVSVALKQQITFAEVVRASDGGPFEFFTTQYNTFVRLVQP